MFLLMRYYIDNLHIFEHYITVPGVYVELSDSTNIAITIFHNLDSTSLDL